MRLLGFIQLACGLVFGVDIAAELALQVRRGDMPGPVDLVHLGLESAAVVGLLVGYRLARRHEARLRDCAAHDHEQLRMIRADFDQIIKQHFTRWSLSEAETDVALLCLRGLKIAQIAALRHTREGTIKAQLSAIFRKAGVRGRSELIGLFMDELLDFAATEPAA